MLHIYVYTYYDYHPRSGSRTSGRCAIAIGYIYVYIYYFGFRPHRSTFSVYTLFYKYDHIYMYICIDVPRSGPRSSGRCATAVGYIYICMIIFLYEHVNTLYIYILYIYIRIIYANALQLYIYMI